MDQIGEYFVRRLVGEGGMGKVYEAEERLSHRRVALKVLRSELTRDDDGRRLFLNEMQILAHLEHPNLVRSLASMEVDGQLVLVLEYLHGRTLRQELTERGPLAWTEAVEHAVRIADALTVAHEQEPSIVHRDLKPENVMLTVDGDAAAEDGAVTGLKVMDFGVAKVLEGVHGTNTQSIGTLQYMSPEQIDAHTIDARSDLYALGLIFYEMLAGSPPFASASPRELLNLQCTAPAPPLPEAVRNGLPRGVEEVLFQLLEKAPSDRPESARAASARLALFCSAGGGTVGAPSVRAALESTKDSGAAPAPRSSERSGVSSGAVKAGRVSAERRESRPPTDTVALVAKNAGRDRELPTWLALIAIGAVSLVAGLTTYVVRVHSGGDAPPAATASAQNDR